ncbi:MAG: DNA-formamidopyrimidine glycosylase family protein, partial [Thermoplasmatota archaeon]
MPELPSVEAFRQHVQDTSLDQPVALVDIIDDYILDETTPAQVEDALTDRCFQGTRRHGKYLFISTGGPWLAMHFGMTGQPVYLPPGQKTPGHTRLLIHFANSHRLAFECQRRLGHIALTAAPSVFVQRKNLGPDALSISWNQFRRRFQPRRGMLKPALMDQHTLAGVGNIIADEIVFQTGLHPEVSIDRLDIAMLQDVYHAMRDILQTAVSRRIAREALPDSYLAVHRNEGEPCPRCGTS